MSTEPLVSYKIKRTEENITIVEKENEFLLFCGKFQTENKWNNEEKKADAAEKHWSNKNT